MFTSFLLGLLAVIAVVGIVSLIVITAQWLHDEIVKRLEARKNHKVAFANTTEVVDSYVKENIDKKQGISMDDLRRACEETPYVVAEIDRDTKEISHYTAYKADKIDSALAAKVSREGGLVVIG